MGLNRRGRRAALLALALVALLGLLAGPVAGDARDLYKEGHDAREAGDLATAVSRYRAAIEERREEKAGWRSYFPFYYLGVALAESGDCPGALLAFGESERQGAIREASDEHSDLQARKASCERDLERLQSLQAAAEAEIAKAEEAAATLDSLSRLPQLAPRWEQDLASGQQRAAERLAAARAALARGRSAGDAAMLETASRQAQEATEAHEQVATAARELLRTLDRAAADALGELEEVEGSLRRILRALSDLEPYRGELAARVAEAEAALAESTGVGTDVRPTDLEQLKDRLTVTMSRLRRAAQRPPQQLADAASAFLAGDYRTTLERLDGLEATDRRTRAQVCLLRGASEHALFVLGGESEAERLDAATAAITACGALSPVPVPPERYFSPRFRALYDATLTGGGISG